MSKFEINFFSLTEINGKYKEEIFYYYSLKLSSIEDVKSFFTSDFYNAYALCKDIGVIGDGVVITENDKVIYKEINEGIFDNKFLIYKDSYGEIFYQVQNDGDIEDKDLVVVDKYNIAGHGYSFEEVDIKEEAIS
jgi:hypothetical protein